MRRVFRIVAFGLVVGGVILLLARGSMDPSRAPVQRADDPTLSAPADEAAPSEDVHGRVIDDTGLSVPNASVTLYGGGPEPTVVAAVVADDAGRLPSALPRGSEGALLVIDARGYPRQARPHDPEQADITIERGTDATCLIADDTGVPLAGATVETFADKWRTLRIGSATADPRGVVTLRIAGEAWLLVRHPGYAHARLFASPWSKMPESLTLAAEFTVGGLIVDSVGRPLEGASVRLQQGDDYAMTLRTGAEGKFLFRGAHDRDARLSTRLEGYCRVTGAVRPGDEGLRIVMRRPASVSGLVVLPGGVPAADAEVRAGDERARTDGAGRFRLEGIEPIAQEIRVYAEGWTASSRVEPKEGTETAGLRIVLQEPVRSFVRVRVYDDDGKGVADVTVYAQSERGLVGKSETGPTGMATIECNEPRGTVASIHAVPPGKRYCDATAPATTSASPDVAPPVEVALHKPIFVRLDARAPDGARPAAVWAQFGGDLFTRYFDEGKGGCWLSPAGEYDVMVGAPGYLQETIEGWRPRRSGDVFAVTLKPEAEVRGRVVVVGATPSRIHVASETGWAGDVPCQPDGAFRMDDFAAGRRVLAFGRKPGVSEARVEVTTRLGEITDLGTITLVPGIVLAGRILDFGGDPIGGARIECRTSILEEHTSTHSRADGTFRIDASAIVGSTVVVQRPGLGAIRTAVAPGPSRAIGDLVLPSAGAAQFEVEGLDAARWWHLSIWWADEPEALVDSFEPRDGRPLRNDDLAPGRYIAALWIGDDRFRQEFEVVAGKATRVAFR